MRTVDVRIPCELCDEVMAAGAALTGFHSDADRPQFSRLIHRTQTVDVIAGLGAVEPGYVLLIPRRHVQSLGELSATELGHVQQLAARMSKEIEREFGGQAVMVEHGSSGTDVAQPTNPACITHAHLHLFPISRHADPAAFVVPGSTAIADLTALRSAATRRRNYYFCSWSTDSMYLTTDAVVYSQHARRVWAGMLGRPEEWDWAVFPHLAACRETTMRLRFDSTTAYLERLLATGDGHAETIAAYDAAAAWYASRTAQFPAGSALRREIGMLAAGTTGTVLDAGAGAGRDSACFGDLGRDVVAVDASGPLLRHGIWHGRVHKVVADIRSLPLADGTVGAVWCSAVLLHLDAAGVRRALREFCRVLKPGGLAHISVKRGHGRASLPMNGDPWHRRHFFYYDPPTMTGLAEVAGFEVMRAWIGDEADVSDTLRAWVKLLLRRPR